MPSADDQCFRTEGVSVVLDEKATAAWKSGEVWNAVNSRTIIARLKLDASCVGCRI